MEDYGILLVIIVLNFFYGIIGLVMDTGWVLEMQKFMEDYENSYNEHVEEITRLQRLLDIEEQKLFELIQIKKQMFDNKRKRRSIHLKPTMVRSQAELC